MTHGNACSWQWRACRGVQVERCRVLAVIDTPGASDLSVAPNPVAWGPARLQHIAGATRAPNRSDLPSVVSIICIVDSYWRESTCIRRPSFNSLLQCQGQPTSLVLRTLR